MSEILDTQKVHRCTGCGKQFDSAADICYSGHPWVEGGQTRNADYCRRCHITALGMPQPHEFKQFD